MSKILDATCENGRVTVETFEISANILSEGVKASNGLLIIQNAIATYIASNASDIKDLIEKLDEVLTKVETVLTGLDAVTNSPGGQASNISLVTTARTEMTTQKDNLK